MFIIVVSLKSRNVTSPNFKPKILTVTQKLAFQKLKASEPKLRYVYYDTVCLLRYYFCIREHNNTGKIKIKTALATRNFVHNSIGSHIPHYN